PKVDSAIVRMIPKENPASCNPEKLGKVVTQAFSQRRKVIRNTLSPLFTATQLENLGIDPTKRPEEIGVAQFIELSNQL
ncbi:MAG: 16S rRNA (adenine(1518)-N(6)/adenine(1519)-N(6))-dimethyltransferase, partial [Oxalobacter sp.]|nr:16S rRNA (adenine(1518)-N(6)/adenine(1519)-N(6))-dimethyltransferase [Oxalobacter sp.]